MAHHRDWQLPWLVGTLFGLLLTGSVPSRADDAVSSLRPGEVRRFGSFEYRVPADTTILAFSPNGKLLAASNRKVCDVVDIASGKRVHRLVTTGKNGGLVSAAAFSRDGKTLFISDGDVAYFDVKSGEAVARFDLEGQLPIIKAKLSADGKWIAALCADFRVRFIRWKTATAVAAIPTDRFSRTLSISADGGMIAINKRIRKANSYEQKILVWKRGAKKPLWELDQPLAPYSLEFSPDGKSLYASGRDTSIRRWDLKTGKLRYEVVIDESVKTSTFLKLSPDGSTLAVGTYRPHGLFLVDAATGKTRHRIDRKQGTTSRIAFTKDGKTLMISGAFSTVRKWNVATGKRITPPFSGHMGRVVGVAFSPDRKRMATLGQEGHICLWDIATGKLVIRSAEPIPAHHGLVRGNAPISFTKDGNSIAANSDRGLVNLWDIERNRLSAFPRKPSNVPPVVSPFPAYARVEGGGVIEVTVPFRQDITKKQRPLTIAGHTGTIAALTISSDGSLMATSSDDKTVRIWRMKDGTEVHKLANLSPAATQLRFSKSGKLLAAASGSAVDVWDAKAGKRRKQIRSSLKSVHDLAFSPDAGRLAVVGTGKEIEIWNVESGKVVKGIPAADPELRAAAFSPDGKLLAVGGEDKKVRIIDSSTGKLRATLSAHSTAISRLLFFSNHEIATGNTTGQVFTWDVKKPTEPISKRYMPHRIHGVGDMSYSPDGYLTVSGGKNALLRFKVRDFENVGETVYLPPQFNAESYALLPDGGSIVLRFRTKLQVVDLETGRKIAETPVRASVVSPVGGRLFFSTREGLFEWDVKSNKQTVRVPAAKWMRGTPIHGITNRGVLLAGRRELVGWDAKTWKEMYRVPDKIWNYARIIGLTRDGGLLVTRQRSVRQFQIWDAERGYLIHTTPPGGRRFVNSKLSPDGLTVAAFDNAAMEIVVMELLTGKVVFKYPGYPMRHTYLSEKTLVLGMRDGTTLAVSIEPKSGKKATVSEHWTALKSKDGAEVWRAFFALIDSGDQTVAFLKKAAEPATDATWDIRSAWAVHVLRRIGSPAARKRLAAIAKGNPDALITREAKRALRLPDAKKK